MLFKWQIFTKFMKEFRVRIVIQFGWINLLSFFKVLIRVVVLKFIDKYVKVHYFFGNIFWLYRSNTSNLHKENNKWHKPHTPSTQKHSTHTHGLHEKHTVIYTLKSNIYSSNNTQHRDITHQIGIQLKRFKWFNRINTFDSAFFFLLIFMVYFFT